MSVCVNRLWRVRSFVSVILAANVKQFHVIFCDSRTDNLSGVAGECTAEAQSTQGFSSRGRTNFCMFGRSLSDTHDTDNHSVG